MAQALWQGHWTAKLRIASGLVLFVYVLFHFLNIGLGLFSLDLMERAQDWRETVTRSAPGSILLYSAFLVHVGFALVRIAGRRTLRMPAWEALQVGLGVLIPFLLIVHIVYTRAAHRLFDVNDEMGYVTGLIWNTPSGRNQTILLLIVWVHGIMGLHFWLRTTTWWHRVLPLMIGFATLVPAFALAGFMVQGRSQKARFFDPDQFAALAAQYNWPTPETFARLNQITSVGLWIFGVLLALTAAVYLGRKFGPRRRAVRIQYIDGPEISAPPGMTLLEMSRVGGVPHMALCGGRGRCTTCRVVVEEGADLLHPPSPEEQASLDRVSAPPNARLACQIRPTNPATVLRVFRPDGRRARDHESLGREKRLAILFLDMRGFTARTTGQLPYDVVFLLNRFFDAIVPSITGAGGTVDKYLGDGLLAVFEQDDETASARAALRAATGISAALATFNQTLIAEKSLPVRIGMGLHLGDLVLGEIGSAENAPRTIIGDAVNTASRLEGQTKALEVEVLVSSSLLVAAGVDLAPLTLRSLTLRGVAHPVPTLAVKRGTELPECLGYGGLSWL